MPNQETILVVDDEIGPRESLRVILSPLYQVYTAAAGEQALGFIHDNSVDLVTLDLNMPGRSGFGVLKAIKDFCSDIKAIVVTCYGNLGNAKEAIRLGAEDFIPKPFNVADITAIVEKSLERRRQNLKVKHLTEQIKTLRSLAHKN
jgi:DNA-binding NtrC family response regulator